MKNINRKTLKKTVITAAAGATLLFSFALASAAGSKTIFAPAKIPPAIISQANAATSAAVVDVTTIYPPQTVTGLVEKIKAKFGKKSAARKDDHTVGVYVGKGLVLTSNSTLTEGAKYRVTLADGSSFDAAPHRQREGLALLLIVSPGVMPEPVKISTTRAVTGDDVAVFGLADVYGGGRYTVMSRAYVNSAQPFKFFTDPQAAPLLAIKVDRSEQGTNFDGAPVFSLSLSGGIGELVGVAIPSVFNADNDTFIVPADTFAAGVKKNLAEN